jgi:hypothetical protein
MLQVGPLCAGDNTLQALAQSTSEMGVMHAVEPHLRLLVGHG